MGHTMLLAPVKSWPQIIVVVKGVAQVVSSMTLSVWLHSPFPPFSPVSLRNTLILCFTFEMSSAWCSPDVILEVLLKVLHFFGSSDQRIYNNVNFTYLKVNHTTKCATREGIRLLTEYAVCKSI